MHRKLTLVAGATIAAAALALPALASAHHATIACDQAHPGQYVVTPDYLHLNPVTTFGPTSATVVWSDRFTVTLPYPTGCVAPPPVVPPAPEPAPPAPPAPTPQAVAAPPVLTPGQPEPMPRKKAAPRPRVTCAWLNAHHAGPRAYTARGWYFRCKAPVPRRLYRVPVTG